MNIVKALATTLEHDTGDTWLSSLMEGLPSVVGYLAPLCGIATLIYIAAVVWKSYAKGESLDFYALLRPFFVSILCINFNYLILQPIQAIFTPLNKYLMECNITAKNDALTGEKASFTRAKQIYDSRLKKMDQTQKDIESGNQSLKTAKELADLLEQAGISNADAQDIVGGVQGNEVLLGALTDAAYGKSFGWSLFKRATKIDRGVKDVGNEIFSALIALIIPFLRWSTKISLLLIRIISISLLVIIGPISFMFSIHPSFKDSMKQWFARFVCVYMWLPFFHIIETFITILQGKVNGWMMELYAGSMMKVKTVSKMASENFSSQAKLLDAGLDIVSIFLYLSIPTIASWIISGGDSSTSLKEVTGGMAKAGALAGGAAVWGIKKGGKLLGGVVKASDRRLKTNITDLQTETNDDMNVLDKIRPVAFDYKPEAAPYLPPGERLNNQVGFIAQEVKEVLPNLVYHDEKHDVYSVDYVGFVPYLVKTLQDQSRRIRDLETKMNEKEDSKEA